MRKGTPGSLRDGSYSVSWRGATTNSVLARTGATAARGRLTLETPRPPALPWPSSCVPPLGRVFRKTLPHRVKAVALGRGRSSHAGPPNQPRPVYACRALCFPDTGLRWVLVGGGAKRTAGRAEGVRSKTPAGLHPRSSPWEVPEALAAADAVQELHASAQLLEADVGL